MPESKVIFESQKISYNGRMSQKPKKRGRGRPPAAPEDLLLQRSIRLTARQWAKVDAGGKQWLRQLIDDAPTPVEPPSDESGQSD